jgi:hypothetical protein
MSNNSTIIGQLLQMFSRYEFQKAVSETGSEYHAKGFTSWNHFVSMLFAQLAGHDSLRGVEAGLATQGRKLYHLGIKPIHRATLAYANKNRPHELFKKLFFQMLSKCQPLAPKHKFRFKNKLYSLDATTIDLCLSMYDWAKFRTTKGAVKLHVKLNHAGYLPNFAVITEGVTPEQKSVHHIPLEANDVVVFDRGYNDYSWYRSLADRNIFFVTRLKKNANYKIVERRSTKHLKNIYSDHIIELQGFYSKQKYPYLLRRIRCKDPESGKIIVVLTNHMSWSAQTIANIYKDRWQIELFFKSLKQQLKVKSFLGTSKNALLSQLWVALIAYLMLSYLKFRSKFKWSVYTLMEILPVNIFSTRYIWDWLNDPYHEKSNSKPPENLQLNFNFV